MKFIEFIRSLFKQEQRILTLTEARQNAKSCYLNEDLAGAERWNEIIAKMINPPML